MKIKEITNYKGRFCAELENGQFILSSFLSNGSMELLLCKKVESGMKVIKSGLVGGIMIRTEENFKWCVEHYLNYMEEIIKTIKKVVEDNGGEVILAMDGINLDTYCDEQEDNLKVTEVTTKLGGKLYGNTTWGLINLEETITNFEDWEILEDAVKYFAD